MDDYQGGLTVVNTTASFRVADKLDLWKIKILFNLEYKPEVFPAISYPVPESTAIIQLFGSGNAVCVGGDNGVNIETGIEWMIGDLRAAGIKTWGIKDIHIEVNNMVAIYNFQYPEDNGGKDKWAGKPPSGGPGKLNIHKLISHLPSDKVVYEPDQFPGLIYYLNHPKVTCLIFGSGKMVITGARHKDEIHEAVQKIQDELAGLL